MGKGYSKWCPYGCGISVYWNRKIWICFRCNKIIARQDLILLNNMKCKT